jgi:hypothetical protein
MAISRPGKANRRAEDAQAAIRGLLLAGNSKQAFHAAIRALYAEIEKIRDYRPADGALTDAELAASLASLAADLPGHRPARPPGCPAVPAPAHLLAAFDAAYSPRQEDQ